MPRARANLGFSSEKDLSMRRLFRCRYLAPALAIAGAAALGGCVAYPAPYGYGYGYGPPAYYQPAPVVGFAFGGWGDHGHGYWHNWR
jgi:hypothetical protein